MSNVVIKNHQIAILNRVNELGERFGLRPEDFLASLEDDAVTAHYFLSFDGPSGIGGANARRMREQFDKMLSCLGLEDEDGIISGREGHVIETLDNALQRAPKPRMR